MGSGAVSGEDEGEITTFKESGTFSLCKITKNYRDCFEKKRGVHARGTKALFQTEIFPETPRQISPFLTSNVLPAKQRSKSTNQPYRRLMFR